jgi:plasmid stabilization system protein ParE
MRSASGGFDNRGAANPAGQQQADATLQQKAKLADDRQRMADDLSRLRKEMQGAMRDLASGEPSAASKLREALGDLERSGLQSRLQKSADLVREGVDPNSNTPSLGRISDDPAISAGLQRLSEQMRQAQQALTNQQNPEEALDRVERLRSQLEALARNLEQGSGRPSQQAPGGKGNQAGSVNNGFQPGPAGGPRVWRGGVDAGGYIEPPGVERRPSPDSPAAMEQALREAMRELNGLRQELRGEPAPLADVQDLIRELQRLGPGRFPGNPALVEQLRTQVLTSVDKLELQLRRELDDKQPGQIRSGDSLQVPSGYKEAVAEYFRRLSQSHY